MNSFLISAQNIDWLVLVSTASSDGFNEYLLKKQGMISVVNFCVFLRLLFFALLLLYVRTYISPSYVLTASGNLF